MISVKTFSRPAMVSRILDIYNLATEAEQRDGRQWYGNAYGFAVAIAKRHDLTVATVAGIIAALSPESHWQQNILDTEAVILLGNAATVSTYSKNKDKAVAILDGRLCPVAHYARQWRKTACFFANILRPDVTGRVTIDRHAARIAHNYHMTSSEAIYYCNTEAKYKATEAAYCEAATVAGLLPHELQAVTWLTYRRIFVDDRYLREAVL